MQITVSRQSPSDPESPVDLQVEGSIDMETRDALLEAARSAISAARALNIDASLVDFVDSLGLTTLIQIERLAKARGVAFSIFRRSRQLDRIFDLMGLTQAFSDRRAT